LSPAATIFLQQRSTEENTAEIAEWKRGGLMTSNTGTYTDDFTDSLSDTAPSVKERMTETANAARQKVSDAGRQATDKIDEKRGPAADALESAASTIHQRAEDLPGGENVRSVAHSAAEKLESTAGYIREHDVRSMLLDVEGIVKRNPGPSLLIAAAIGFLIGRAFRED
jgi:ElaB/YqjD/DUF883 family membrane-anchored ribosome-binding protein